MSVLYALQHLGYAVSTSLTPSTADPGGAVLPYPSSGQNRP